MLDEVDDQAENYFRFDDFSQLAQLVYELAVNVQKVGLSLVETIEYFLEVAFGYFPQVVKDLGIVAIFLLLFLHEVGLLLKLALFFLVAFLFIKDLLVGVELLQVARVHLLQHFLHVG